MAAVLNISPVTLFRELRMAKAWLYGELAPPVQHENDTATTSEGTNAKTSPS